nr:hypothetical protein [uncultured Dysosmobacter sp.]
MNISENETRRASNLIWNAARDYTFEPQLRVFDREGRAELYWNSVVGAAWRHFDREKLDGFFRSFDGAEDQGLFENLTWMALENAVFLRERADRPALPRLREEYARRAVGEMADSLETADLLELAHFRRVLGQPTKLPPREQALLEALEPGPDLDTDALIARLQAVFAERFGYRPGQAQAGCRRRGLFGGEWFAGKKKQQLPPVRGFAFGYGKYSDGGSQVAKRNRSELGLPVVQTPEGLKKYIRDYFGPPCCPEKELAEMERDYCTGNHRSCHIHFTRGLSADRSIPKGYVGAQKKANIKRTVRNRAFYREHLVQNQMTINRLTSQLRSSLLTQMDANAARANAGQLEAGRVWRGLYLQDHKIFARNANNTLGSLSVDILLDASTSQLQRQETIVTQCYIIAESLTRCGLPVRVYSFSSISGYTTLTLFRDYQEPENNDNIFNYFPCGCNRDGLGIRIAAGRMARTDYEHKLLIVLSDVKPNGVVKVETSEGVFQNYADELGIADTAAEVHRAKMNGVSVICVFTGNDADLPAARRVYGHNLARIRSLNQFADTVGKLILMQIKNL